MSKGKSEVFTFTNPAITLPSTARSLLINLFFLFSLLSLLISFLAAAFEWPALHRWPPHWLIPPNPSHLFPPPSICLFSVLITDICLVLYFFVRPNLSTRAPWPTSNLALRTAPRSFPRPLNWSFMLFSSRLLRARISLLLPLVLRWFSTPSGLPGPNSKTLPKTKRWNSMWQRSIKSIQSGERKWRTVPMSRFDPNYNENKSPVTDSNMSNKSTRETEWKQSVTTTELCKR